MQEIKALVLSILDGPDEVTEGGRIEPAVALWAQSGAKAALVPFSDENQGKIRLLPDRVTAFAPGGDRAGAV